MIRAAALSGWIDGDKAMMESLIAFERAGADGVLTDFAPRAAEKLRAKEAAPDLATGHEIAQGRRIRRCRAPRRRCGAVGAAWVGFFGSPVSRGWIAAICPLRGDASGEAGGGQAPFVGVRTGGGEREFDAARADADEASELEKLERDRAAGRLGELRTFDRWRRSRLHWAEVLKYFYRLRRLLSAGNLFACLRAASPPTFCVPEIEPGRTS
jgi:hypothetical protein